MVRFRELIQLHIAPDGIFIVFLAFFFLCVCTGRDTVRVHICTKRDTIRDPILSRCRDVAALRADVAQLCYRLPLSPHWSLRRLRTRARPRETVTHCLVSLSKVSFFIIVFFFGFMPMPILVLVFIIAQTAAAAALSLRTESLATTS